MDELLTPDPADPLRNLAAVARDVLGPAACPHPRTLFRWAGKGVVVGGRRVRLSTVRIGAFAKTTARAFRAFITELNARTDQPAPALRSPAKRRRESERAAAELERMGV